MLKIKNTYDVIIIGSGPSGIACATRCGQLNLSTLCIDNLAQQDDDKKLAIGQFNNAESFAKIALLESAKKYVSVLHEINSHGIYADKVSLNISQLMRRKDTILNTINTRYIQLLNDNKVDFIHAKAKLLNHNTVEITSNIAKKFKQLSSQHIVLATESLPIRIPCAPVDNEFIIDSLAALNLKEVPKRLAILGAGIAGLELANIWNRLGSETILLDAQESFLNLTDQQISREAYKIFTDQGLELCLGTRVTSTKLSNKKVLVEYQDSDGTHAIRVDKLIVASGRRPHSENLAAPEANLLLNENGFIHVDEKNKTNLPNVFAIGDLTLLGPMLAQKGMAEGEYVAEQIAGASNTPIDYGYIPNVIHTDPEIAWVGQTEQTLKALGESIKIGMVNLKNNPKAHLTDHSEGLIKTISCAKTDNILGVHIIANNASELIGEATLAMEFSANNEDIKNTIHPFPSFVETLNEASKLSLDR